MTYDKCVYLHVLIARVRSIRLSYSEARKRCAIVYVLERNTSVVSDKI